MTKGRGKGLRETRRIRKKKSDCQSSPKKVTEPKQVNKDKETKKKGSGVSSQKKTERSKKLPETTETSGNLGGGKKQNKTNVMVKKKAAHMILVGGGAAEAAENSTFTFNNRLLDIGESGLHSLLQELETAKKKGWLVSSYLEDMDIGSQSSPSLAQDPQSPPGLDAESLLSPPRSQSLPVPSPKSSPNASRHPLGHDVTEPQVYVESLLSPSRSQSLPGPSPKSAPHTVDDSRCNCAKEIRDLKEEMKSMFETLMDEFRSVKEAMNVVSLVHEGPLESDSVLEVIESDNGQFYKVRKAVMKKLLPYNSDPPTVARRLADLIFTQEERMHSNVKGVKGKSKLDTAKVSALRMALEQLCTLEDKERMWIRSVKAIDSASRYLKFKKSM